MTATSAPQHVSSPQTPPRRPFFRWLTYLVGAIAAAVVAIPFVGYLLALRKPPKDWFPLGPVKNFPENETRMHMFDNPIRQPWDGMTAHTGVFVRNQGVNVSAAEQFLVLAVNCAHLGCPVS